MEGCNFNDMAPYCNNPPGQGLFMYERLRTAYDNGTGLFQI
jgi:hypothetical protein